MKKLLLILLATVLCFSLTACGDKGNTGTPSDSDKQGETEGNKPDDIGKEEISAWLKTKTGKFYSQFNDGKMYMEYEMNYDGELMKMITATNGEKTYSETIIDGKSAAISIMDSEAMYMIDHENKMVIKMALEQNSQSVVNAVIEEENVDVPSMQSGTREIDGKKYDTETLSMDGASTTMCFDSDDLVYMITEYEGTESVIKITRFDNKVDESLFELPKEYQVVSY